MVEGVSLKDYIGRVERSIKTIFSKMIHHRIKVSVKLSVIACVRRLLAVVTETSAKTCGLAGS